MARGRMVSQSINLDPQFNSLSPDAQLMFLRTVPFLDRDGLILGNPVALWARVAPLMTDFQARMGGIISEWVRAGLCMAYTDRGRDVLWFKGFRKNQSGMRYDRESESDFNPPPGYDYGDSDFVPNAPPKPDSPVCDTTPDSIRQDSGKTPECVRQDSRPIEVKLSEGEGNDGAQPAATQAEKRTQPSPSQIANTPSALEGVKHRAQRNVRTFPGIEPKLLTGLANEVKRIRGLEKLIQKPGRDDVEDECNALAFDLHELGYKTPQSLQALHERWKAYAQNFSNPHPYRKQLYEFAARTQGEITQTTTPTTLDFAWEDALK